MGEPAAKHTIRKFDAYLMQRGAFDSPETKLTNVRQWLAPDFIYDVVGFPGARSPAEWCLSGEEQIFRTAMNMSSFTQMLFFGTGDMATTTSYGTVYWGEPLFGVPAPNEWITFRVTDFYAARRAADKAMINYNFMIIDFADLFRRAGRRVLPLASLPEGHYLPPAVQDGVPAPLSRLVAGRDATAAQAVAEAILREDWLGSGEAVRWSTGLRFYGSGGIGMATSKAQLREHVLTPFHAAFANRSLHTQILDCEGNYCGALGVLRGLHVGTWLGAKASDQSIDVRFAMHWRIEDGLAEEAWCLFDIPGFFSQLGLDFFAMASSGISLD